MHALFVSSLIADWAVVENSFPHYFGVFITQWWFYYTKRLKSDARFNENSYVVAW